MAKPGTKSGVINSLVRGLNILEAVASEKGGASAKQVSFMLGLKLGTAYHLLNTLIEAGYLLKDEETQKFYLSNRIPYLHNMFIENHSLIPLLKPFLNLLLNQTSEMVALAVRDGVEIVLADMVESRNAVRVAELHIGYREHCYARALGKPILAFMRKDELEGHLLRHPIFSRQPAAVKNREELERELASVRNQGFCIDNQEFAEGVCSVGAPIFDFSGTPVASLAIAVPASRFENRRPDLISLIKTQSLLASRNLGFAGL